MGLEGVPQQIFPAGAQLLPQGNNLQPQEQAILEPARQMIEQANNAQQGRSIPKSEPKPMIVHVAGLEALFKAAKGTSSVETQHEDLTSKEQLKNLNELVALDLEGKTARLTPPMLAACKAAGIREIQLTINGEKRNFKVSEKSISEKQMLSYAKASLLITQLVNQALKHKKENKPVKKENVSTVSEDYSDSASRIIKDLIKHGLLLFIRSEKQQLANEISRGFIEFETRQAVKRTEVRHEQQQNEKQAHLYSAILVKKLGEQQIITSAIQKDEGIAPALVSSIKKTNDVQTILATKPGDKLTSKRLKSTK